MNPKAQENRMRRYLLGDLPESETHELEVEVLRDDEKFEEMWELENRLIDDYVRGRLSSPDRARFERHYQASPIHRQRVAVARNLVDEADASRVTVTSRPATLTWGARLSERLGFSLLSWKSAWTLSVLLYVVSGFWLLLDRTELRRNQEQLIAENQSRQNREQVLSQELASAQQESKRLESEIATLRGEQKVQQPAILALLLSPMLVRSSGTPQTVAPSPQTDLIRLQMAVEQRNAEQFQVSIRTVEGARVWENQIKSRAGATNSIISADIPVSTLPVGDYILTLSQINSKNEPQELNRYFFRIIRQ